MVWLEYDDRCNKKELQESLPNRKWRELKIQGPGNGFKGEGGWLADPPTLGCTSVFIPWVTTHIQVRLRTCRVPHGEGRGNKPS